LEPDLPFFAEFEPDVLVAPIGTVMPWSNPSTGHYGEIEVLDDGYDESANLPCRTYRTTVVIDGRPETAVGTACREADGTWRLVN
jgi:surface antigen